jgi:Leucine-rich repeat (LRR) protein
MFIKLLYILLPLVHSHCYSKSSQTWICNNRSRIDDYQNILTNEKFVKFFLKNYQLSVFKIDQYPLTLRLFNASNNQFERIVITSKNRYQSNLRQLILQSNNIRSFNMDNIVLPQTLEIISLANNRLEILDARIFLSLKNLTKLDLRNNLLKRILPQLLLNRNILLNNNPLDCQCTPDFYRILCQKSTNVKQPTVS